LLYHITVPTLALYCPDGEREVPIQLPADAVLRVPDVVGEVQVDGKSEAFVDVEWEAKRLRMFVIDLLERGQVVRTP
jgi:hypothetical protein